MTERTAEIRGLLARTRSDASLFERALAGDPVAFSEVYRRYHSRVYAFCLSRLLDPSLAEDAAQETFVRFLHADPASVQNPRAWLFSVARNVSVDIVRQRVRVDSTAAEEDDAFGGVAADTGDEMLRREQGRTIMLAMRRMRPRYRSALILRELHGLSSAEMAEALDSTPGAVDTMVSRARDAFGRLYAEVCDLPGECGAAFPLIYKRMGTGLSGAETARLDAHIDECPRCRAENRSAQTPGRLAGALPFLLPLGASKRGVLGQIFASLDPTLLTTPAAAAPTLAPFGLKIATAALAVATVAVPVSATVGGGHGLGGSAGPVASRVRATTGSLHAADGRVTARIGPLSAGHGPSAGGDQYGASEAGGAGSGSGTAKRTGDHASTMSASTSGSTATRTRTATSSGSTSGGTVSGSAGSSAGSAKSGSGAKGGSGTQSGTTAQPAPAPMPKRQPSPTQLSAPEPTMPEAGSGGGSGIRSDAGGALQSAPRP